MLIDPFGRTIDYLRVSITDKCNYRCVYCMPEEGIALKSHREILSYESIALIASFAGKLGITKIRLTGGEPLVKRDIELLIKMLHLTNRFNEITMTTNASLLTTQKAKLLKESGLTRINISLDTLDPNKFSHITRGGNINDVFAGINAAKVADLNPIKINMIIFNETTDLEISTMRDFCNKNGLKLQTIKHFALYNKKHTTHSFDRPGNCGDCNRLRLTADGFLKPCLFSNKEIKIDFNNIEKSIQDAVDNKPNIGSACENRCMCQIGG